MPWERVWSSLWRVDAEGVLLRTTQFGQIQISLVNNTKSRFGWVKFKQPTVINIQKKNMQKLQVLGSSNKENRFQFVKIYIP